VTKQAPTPEGIAPVDVPISQVIVSEGLVYTSGQVAEATDFDAEAHEVLRKIGACLAAAGCSYSDVLKVNVYLRDLANFPAFNDVYRSYFKPPFPVRTTVRADLVADYRLEIDAIARVP
jgi:2-iminobutanoate/2-iminopropanoate deaminase